MARTVVTVSTQRTDGRPGGVPGSVQGGLPGPRVYPPVPCYPGTPPPPTPPSPARHHHRLLHVTTCLTARLPPELPPGSLRYPRGVSEVSFLRYPRGVSEVLFLRNPGYSTTVPAEKTDPAFAIFLLSPGAESGQKVTFLGYPGLQECQKVTFLVPGCRSGPGFESVLKPGLFLPENRVD